MNLVDSSGWLEYFADGTNANFFTPAIEDAENLIVSTINVYEVFKKVLKEKDENSALEAIAIMHHGKIIDINNSIAINAAKISHGFKMPMADSLIYATALQNEATVWTQDEDFKDLDMVRYIKK